MSFLFIQESDIFFLENGLESFLEASLLPGFDCCCLCLVLEPGERLSPLPQCHICLEL